MKHTFPLTESLSYGFHAMWKHIGLIIVSSISFALMAIVVAVTMIGTGIGAFLLLFMSSIWAKAFGISLAIATIAALLFLVSLTLGYLRIMLDIYDTGMSHINQLFCCFSLAGRALGAFIIYSLMCIAGYILLILPGLIIAARFMFFTYFIVDKNAGLLDSLRMSWQLTKGHTWMTVLFLIIMHIIQAIGYNLLFVHLVIAPALLLATIYVYRNLRPRNKTIASA